MSRELRYVAEQLRGDHIAVAQVWRDDVRRQFTSRFFDPGLRSIQVYLAAYENLAEAIDEAESVASGF